MRCEILRVLTVLTLSVGLLLAGCAGKGGARSEAGPSSKRFGPKATIKPPEAPPPAPVPTASAEALAASAKSRASVGDAEGALADYAAALAADPAHASAAAWRANRGLLIAESRGHFPSALEELNAAVAAAPQRADIRQKRGYVHLKAADAYGRAGQQAEARDELLAALADLDAALAADANLAGAHEQRGTVLTRLGERPADAVADLTEARRRAADPASQQRIDAMLATFKTATP